MKPRDVWLTLLVMLLIGMPGPGIAENPDPARCHGEELERLLLPINNNWPVGLAIRDDLLITGGTLGLALYDVSNPAAPRALGGIDLSVFRTMGVALGPGNLVTVAAEEDGLMVVDVSDPSAPFLVGSFAIEETYYFCSAVAVRGDYAYATFGGYGLLVIDLSDPWQPQQVAWLRENAVDVDLEGNLAAIASARGITFIDVSEPTDPVVISQLGTDSTSVDLVGSIAYSAEEEGGLLIIDADDPAQPQVMATVPGYVEAVTVIGSTAFLGRAEEGLELWDVSQPAVPRLLGTVATPASPQSVTSDGRYLYVGHYDGWLVVDANDPARPEVISSQLGIGSALDVEVDATERFAYIADGLAGLLVVDLDAPWPDIVSHRLPFDGRTAEIELYADTLFVGTFPNYAPEEPLTKPSYLHLVDITDAVQPVIMASLEIEGSIWDLDLAGDRYVYIISNGTIYLVDVEQPSNPTIVTSLRPNDKETINLAVEGSTLALAQRHELVLMDVSDPLSPAALGSVGLWFTRAMEMAGQHVYVARTSYGAYLQLIDIGDPLQPTFAGSIVIDRARPHTILAEGPTIYFGTTTGVYSIDATNPGAPTLLFESGLKGHAYGLTISGSSLLIAGGHSLATIDLACPKPRRGGRRITSR
jgi:hypothetical protein